MPFGRSKSLRSKPSNVVPTKENNIPTPRFVFADTQPRSELNLLRTSLLFPDGGPDIVPTPAKTRDDLHLLRTSTLFPGECRVLSSFGSLETAERPRTADERSGGEPMEQSLNRPRPTRQGSSPPAYEASLPTNHDEANEEEMAIGMALGDPEDLSWTTREQDIVTHHSSNEPSTTSSTPIPQSEVRKAGDGTGALKRKPSKWKILGGIFGKRGVSSASSTTQFYQIQYDSSPTPHHQTNKPPYAAPPPHRVEMPNKKETSEVVHRGKGRNHRSISS
ncbi:MAG: hypothetical protein M1830_008361, partial [Pleopsidium flavum]